MIYQTRTRPFVGYISLVLCLFLLPAVAPPSFATADEDQAVVQLQNLNKAFTSIARKVTPTVVTIGTKQVVERTSRRRMPNFPFHPFFEDPRSQEPQEREPERERGEMILSYFTKLFSLISPFKIIHSKIPKNITGLLSIFFI